MWEPTKFAVDIGIRWHGTLQDDRRWLQLQRSARTSKEEREVRLVRDINTV